MSHPSLLARLAVAAACLTIAAEATAQVAWTQVQLSDAAINTTVRRLDNSVNGPLAESAGVAGGANGYALANIETGQLKAAAYTSDNRHVWMGQQTATAGAGMILRMSIGANCPPGGCPAQPVELYFHSLLFGSSLPLPGFNASAGVLFQATAWELGESGSRTRLTSKSLSAGVTSPTFGGSVHDDQQLRELLLLPLTTGAHLFEIVLTMDASAWNGYSADASHTGTVYVPHQAGYTYDLADGALAAQARPDWATVTTPEPSTLLLTVGGLAALGVGARRRREQRRA